jgi:hypothetical protein
MGIRQVLSALDAMKNDGIFQEYAVCGGYAVMFYDLPFATYDLDVLVSLPPKERSRTIDLAHTKIYEYSRSKGFKIDNVHVFISDMPVQFLPSSISPLFDDAIKKSLVVNIDGVFARFVSREHLILMLLTSFRPVDKIRIKKLLEKASKSKLSSLITRLDDEKKTLFKRYKKILERA